VPCTSSGGAGFSATSPRPSTPPKSPSAVGWPAPATAAPRRCGRDPRRGIPLPGVVKTYAPEGLTPVLREKQTRDHLSVMGGMTPEGRVYTLVRQESLNGMHPIEFLLHLLRVVGDRLLVIWDGSPIHRRAEVREFVASTRGRVWLEALPGYAPDLNPWDEGGWHHLKDVEMRNLVCRDLDELHQELDLAVGRLRQKPHLVRSFFAQARLQLQGT
jgi:transposase